MCGSSQTIYDPCQAKPSKIVCTPPKPFKRKIPLFLLCDSGVQHNNTQSRQNDKQIYARALIKLCVAKQMSKTRAKYSKMYECVFFSEISEYRFTLVGHKPKICLPKWCFVIQNILCIDRISILGEYEFTLQILNVFANFLYEMQNIIQIDNGHL